MVVGEEWGDLAHPLLDVPAEEDLRVVGQLAADEQVEVAEPQGEEEAVDRVADVDAGRPLPDGVRAGLAARIGVERVVELGGRRRGHDVRIGLLAEVDARLGDRQPRLAVDAADEVVGRAGRRDRVDRDGRDPVAVGVDELLLGPGAVRAEQLDVQLARGQHDLALLVLDLVAVDVDVGEAVVAAEVLLLPERRQQRPVVPQPQVVDRRLVLAEDLGGRAPAHR